MQYYSLAVCSDRNSETNLYSRRGLVDGNGSGIIHRNELAVNIFFSFIEDIQCVLLGFLGVEVPGIKIRSAL